jgi:hypothetical protein
MAIAIGSNNKLLLLLLYQIIYIPIILVSKRLRGSSLNNREAGFECFYSCSKQSVTFILTSQCIQDDIAYATKSNEILVTIQTS